MNIVKLDTAQQKAQGVIDHDVLDDDVFVFVGIAPGAMFHMKGVEVPIDIVFLDRNYSVLERSTMQPSTGGATAPEGTAHAVEMLEGAFGDQTNIGEIWKSLYSKI